jgi:hypothetical protein
MQMCASSHIFVWQACSSLTFASWLCQNEDDVAQQLVGFMQQFLEVFSELKGKHFYVAGASVSTDLS